MDFICEMNCEVGSVVCFLLNGDVIMLIIMMFFVFVCDFMEFC